MINNIDANTGWGKKDPAKFWERSSARTDGNLVRCRIFFAPPCKSFIANGGAKRSSDWLPVDLELPAKAASHPKKYTMDKGGEQSWHTRTILWNETPSEMLPLAFGTSFWSLPTGNL